MRVCNKCRKEASTLHLIVDHEEYDFCHEHAMELIEFLKGGRTKNEFRQMINGEPVAEKRRGRPPKNLGITPE